MTTHMPELAQSLSFRSGTEWRKWLVRNHKRPGGVWLAICKKNSKTKGLRYIEALEEALCFGWIDGKMKSVDEDRFILWFCPRRKGSIWSESNKQRIRKLTNLGKMAPPGIFAVKRAKHDGSWKMLSSNRLFDSSIEKGYVPVDFEKSLQESDDAWANFIDMAPSYRRQYVYWIESAKLPQTRTKRILRAVDRISRDIKPGIDL